MQRVRFGVVLAVVSLLCACELDDGGGGGGGTFSFVKGFVFVRTGDLYAVNETDTQDPGQLTTNGNNKQPSLSDDGVEVVFIHTSGTTTSIQAVSSSGGTPRTLLTSDDTYRSFRTPVFSGDRQSVVFVFDQGGGSNPQVGLVSATGTGTLEELTPSTIASTSPTFYPDGVNVLVVKGTSNQTLEKLNIDDPSAVTTVSTSLDATGTAFRVENRLVLSPDGQRIAFDARVNSSTGPVRIFVRDLVDSDARQLTDYPGDPTTGDGFPTWIGSAEVAYGSDSGGSDNVYSLDAATELDSGALQVGSAKEAWYGPN